MAWTERYVRADAAGGGNGTTDTNSGANGAWTVAEAVSGMAAGHRINVRAGTYSLGAVGMANNGTAAAPIWWRGFTSTPGDCDAWPTAERVPGTDIPLFSLTGVWTFQSAHSLFTDLAWQRTAGTAIAASSSGTPPRVFVRCLFESTVAAAAAYAITMSTTSSFIGCRFKATSTADYVVSGGALGLLLYGCVATGGGIGFRVSSATGTAGMVRCIARATGSHGFDIASGNFNSISECTAIGCGGSGIRISSTTGGQYSLVNNVLVNNSAYGIENSSGANINVLRIGNLFYNNTSGKESGFGDVPSLDEQVDTALPFISTTDLTLTPTSNGRGNAIPRLWPWEPYSSGQDIGAVQMSIPTDAQIAAAIWAYASRTLTS